MESTKVKKPFFKTFIGNLIIIIGVCVALYWLFFGSLSIITKHNDVRIVPDLSGMTIDSAAVILEKQGFEIKVDSVYDKTFPLHAVIDQQPEKGSKVKVGRIIFLTVNKANPPMVSLPNLINMPLRTALIELKKNGLEMGDTTFVFDVSAGTVLEMNINGSNVTSGTKVPAGSIINLVVSKGLSDEIIAIPNLIGLTLPEALKIIQEKELRYRLTSDGTVNDSTTAIIFYQYPESRNDYGEPMRFYKGENVDIKIGQNPVIEKKNYIPRPTYNNDSENDETTSNQDENNNVSGSEKKSNPPSSKKEEGPLPPTYPKTESNNKNNSKESTNSENKPKDSNTRPNRPNR